MKIEKNILLNDSYGKPIATDIFFQEDGKPKPVIIYAHGFNGFKDWGNFDLIAKRFATEGFVFIKFNFSFNGTTPDHPEEFVDLEAYADNNYSKELSNLDAVVNWASADDNPYVQQIDKRKIGLIGHSLGGGIVVLHTATDDRIKALATWASISTCRTPWGFWPEPRLEDWKNAGVEYVMNSRTKQNLPLNYQLYEDYLKHSDRLNIEKAARQIEVPWLICHGSSDPGVNVSSAYDLHQWNPSSSLFILDTDHVFGRKHPWVGEDLPEPMEQVLARTIAFFKQSFNSRLTKKR